MGKVPPNNLNTGIHGYHATELVQYDGAKQLLPILFMPNSSKFVNILVHSAEKGIRAGNIDVGESMMICMRIFILYA